MVSAAGAAILVAIGEVGSVEDLSGAKVVSAAAVVMVTDLNFLAEAGVVVAAVVASCEAAVDEAEACAERVAAEGAAEGQHRVWKTMRAKTVT